MIDHDLDRKAMDVVGRLAELPRARRLAEFDTVCGDDPRLRDRVVSLLRELSDEVSTIHGSDGSGSFDFGPAVSSPVMPSRFGQFQILRLIGAGGMGEVYEAEQDRPRRRVALKVVRSAKLTAAALRRFEYEAEWLARLDHPGIARVHDAGTAIAEGADGAVRLPYFAMELIEGTRLDHWAEALPPLDSPGEIVARVRLLIDLCDAVHHAHQKGLIHRDLKPANIIVTASGQPKILDFGIARSLGESAATNVTMHTTDGALVGTLGYMSPEQAAGQVDQLDTRSDVYALGVIAYELLCGHTPHEVKTLPLPAALAAIRETDPPALETRDRRLRGDLSTIVAKALEKRKEDRYDSAAAMAADLRAFLEDRPIAARPAGLWYHARKFARRRRGLVVAGALVLATLLAGIAGTTWGLIAARRSAALAEEKQRDAEVSRNVTEQVNEYLQDMLLAADPGRAGGDPGMTVRQMLDRAADDLPNRFNDEPLVKAALLNSLGTSYHGLGEYARAADYFTQSRALWTQHRGPRAKDALVNANNLAGSYIELGRFAEAERLLRETVDDFTAEYGPDDPQTLRAQARYGLALHALGRYADALLVLSRTHERQTVVFGPDHPDRLGTANNYILVLIALGRSAEAEPLAREILQRYEAISGPKHADTLGAINNLSSTLMNQHKYEEAEKYQRELLDRCRAIFGPDHRRTLIVANNLASTLDYTGRHADAAELFRASADTSAAVYGRDDLFTIQLVMNLANSLNRAGHHEEAEPLQRDAIDRMSEKLGPKHDRVLNARNNLASLLIDRGRADEALSIVTETLPAIEESLAPDHPYVATALHIRAKALEQTGDRDGALAAFDELMRLCDSPDRKFPEALAEQYRQSRRRFLGPTD